MAGFYPPPPVFVGGAQPYDGIKHVTASYVPDNPPKRGPLDKNNYFLLRDAWNPGPPMPQMWRPRVTASYVPDNPPRKARLDVVAGVIRQAWEPGPPLPQQARPRITQSGVAPDNPPIRGPLDYEIQVGIRSQWEAGPWPPHPRARFTPSGGDQPRKSSQVLFSILSAWLPPFQLPQRSPFLVPAIAERVPVGPIDYPLFQTIWLAWQQAFAIPPHAPFYPQPPIVVTPDNPPVRGPLQQQIYQTIWASWQQPFVLPPVLENVPVSGPPDVIVIPPAPDFGLPPGGGGKRERRRRVVVEIDGEEFVVSTEAEARALLAQTQELARTQAQIAAKSALNRARKLRRKTGGLRLPTLEVAIPELRVLTPQASPEIAAMFAAAQAAIDEIYLRSAQALELAYLARREYEIGVDDEEVIDLLLRGE